MRLIPFKNDVPDDHIDRKLMEKLRAEYGGILRWLTDGATTWAREGLGTCSAVSNYTKEYRDEQDRVAAFIEECCEKGSFTIKAGELYAAYRNWAEEQRERPMGHIKFGGEAKRLFESFHTRVGWHYDGLRIISLIG